MCTTSDVGGTCGPSCTPRSTHYLLTTPIWKRSIRTQICSCLPYTLLWTVVLNFSYITLLITTDWTSCSAYSAGRQTSPGMCSNDLSTCKWGHGSSVSWASFLPIFSMLRPPILYLGTGTGQTDRQTTRPQCLMPPPCGAGHNNSLSTEASSSSSFPFILISWHTQLNYRTIKSQKRHIT